MAFYLAWLGLAMAVAAEGANKSRIWFSTALGDNMVLQHDSPRLWGWADSSAGLTSVTVNVKGADCSAAFGQSEGQAAPGKWWWNVTLPPSKPSNAPVQIGVTMETADGASSNAVLNGVLYGDVWFCSGQSNMAFLVEMAFNGSQAVQDANNYPFIRLFTAAKNTSDQPLPELLGVEQPWSIASSESISMNSLDSTGAVQVLRDDNWLYFSATCWFTAINIYKRLQYPLGLVSSNWGGTMIESWASPAVFEQCNRTSNTLPDSSLWNAMIVPFLPMGLRGWLWYQGESNTNYGDYDCMFSNMIADWRLRWSAYASAGGSPIRPFGFVQLAGFQEADHHACPDTRWKQTAALGYVPNARMPNVFMAVAYDLGDPTSPYEMEHSRYKQDVGLRLSRAALALAYGTADYWTGPIATAAALLPANASRPFASVLVSFEPNSVAKGGMQLRPGDNSPGRLGGGFEVCTATATIPCTTNSSKQDNWFRPISQKSILVSGVPAVLLGVNPNTPSNVTHVRFSWLDYPCRYKMCGLYSDDLPAPPFVVRLGGVIHN